MTVILFFLIISSAAVAGEELPEPTVQDIGYECEIGFGTLSGIVWQQQPIQYHVIDGEPAGTHAYWSTLGVQKFEASACVPNKKVVFQFEINKIPEGLPFVFYRVRLRGFIGEIKGEWSEPSYWVGIININIPSRPVH